MWVDTSAAEPWGFMALWGVPLGFCHLFVPPELPRRAHRGRSVLEEQKWDKNCCAQPPPVENGYSWLCWWTLHGIWASCFLSRWSQENRGSKLAPCVTALHTHIPHTPLLLLLPPSTCSLVYFLFSLRIRGLWGNSTRDTNYALAGYNY